MPSPSSIAAPTSPARFAGAALAAAFLLARPPATRAEPCSRGVVCVEAVEGEGRVELWARSLVTYDITLSLTVGGDNLAADAPLPVTRTLPRGFDGRLLTLTRKHPGEGWEWRYAYHWVRGRLVAHPDLAHPYQLPFAAGSRQIVMQGAHGTFTHRGDEEYAVDWDLGEGTMVYAARGGVVTGVERRFERGGTDARLRDEGNFVSIRQEDGTEAEYYHFQRDGVLVEAGQEVKAGDALGFSGHTGFAKGPHLHFMVFKAVDGWHRESFPVRFVTAEEGVTEVRTGRGYTRPR